MSFDNHTIYRIYIEEQKRIIKVKDLQIFEDTEIKQYTILLNYKNSKPIFQGFLLDDNDEKKTFNTLDNSTTAKPNISIDTGKPKTSKDAVKPKVLKDTAKPKCSDIAN